MPKESEEKISYIIIIYHEGHVCGWGGDGQISNVPKKYDLWREAQQICNSLKLKYDKVFLIDLKS